MSPLRFFFLSFSSPHDPFAILLSPSLVNPSLHILLLPSSLVLPPASSLALFIHASSLAPSRSFINEPHAFTYPLLKPLTTLSLIKTRPSPSSFPCSSLLARSSFASHLSISLVSADFLLLYLVRRSSYLPDAMSSRSRVSPASIVYTSYSPSCSLVFLIMTCPLLNS